MVDCCRPYPACTHFCRLDGHLLKGKGIIHNPNNGYKYEVLNVFAEGGMGVTYLVFNHQTNNLSVLKEIRSKLSSEEKIRELFQREARVLKSLDNPGIPQFYDFFVSDNHYSLIMEMIYGESLNRINPSTEKEVVGWMWELAKILDYLHNLPQPIIHRDIKPGNLILRHNPKQIVLIDFGAVKEVTLKPGTRITSASFSSPEQKKGLSFIQSDFYALGTTLIYLLTKKSPNRFRDAVTNRFTGLKDSGISDELITIINLLTKYNPFDRPSSAIDVIDMLGEFLEN